MDEGVIHSVMYQTGALSGSSERRLTFEQSFTLGPLPLLLFTLNKNKQTEL